MIIETPQAVMIKNSIITASVFVAVVMRVSYWFSNRLTLGRVHGSAIAIAVGLLLTYVGGVLGGESKGIADIPMLIGKVFSASRCSETLRSSRQPLVLI